MTDSNKIQCDVALNPGFGFTFIGTIELDVVGGKASGITAGLRRLADEMDARAAERGREGD